MVRKLGCDLDDASTLVYKKIYDTAMVLANTADTMKEFNMTRDTQGKLSGLVDDIQLTKAKAVTEGHVVPVSKPAAAIDKDGVNQLTQAFERLALPIQAAVNRLAVSANTVPVSGAGRGMGQDQVSAMVTGADYSSSCFCCGGIGHIQRTCPELQSMISAREVHINEVGRICHGPADQKGASIYVPLGVRRIDAVRTAVQRAKAARSTG